ncbi:MAG TPA: tetratricopeptide repeat protein [Methylomirabilota bacterium]|nr:tetratricopeptide repeat protein [Methylomirabilota bacterium]
MVPARAPDSYTPKHLAEKILTSKSALEGERKQVTVLFADLKGSMELLADRDPEEARKLLDPVLEHMMEAVHRYEGTVNQVMGDGIMALFGAPLAHEDHAVRACYAALRMQESVKRYAEGIFRTYGVPVRIRVGLNSGEVVVRSIGSDLHMDYTAVGQTTHLAARMEQMADPGAILLTSDTLHLAEGFVQVRSLGTVAVKGLAAPAEIFELTGASPVRSRLQAAAARGLTTFVGRDAEMDTLFTALEQAKAGKGQVVAVVGEPGVGKSRLFWEFTHSHRTQGCLVLEAASVSYGKATTFLPVIDLLKDYFQIEPRDDTRKISEKVTGKLFSLDRALESCIAPVLWMLDAPVEDADWKRLDPSLQRQRLLDGLRRLVLRESQVQPLVLVFEDLHWIDGETQAFLDYLMESLPTARLLLLVNYRPEYRHDWGSKSYYRQLRIDPLSPASADQLLGALLGHDPSVIALRPLLIVRTEGNPFFLEESVQSLVETGALAGERGAYRLVKSPEALNMPATVQTILAARIDRLAPEDKRLVQTAAVVGKDVPYSLLQAIAAEDETALRASLARLQAAEFLYEVQLFPEAEYTFKHALTHEVAYGGMLQERRRTLHARIIEAIETRYPDRLAEQVNGLAGHAMRGEVWDKALHYYQLVGHKDFDRRAYHEAVTAYEQALEALRHLPENPDTRPLAVELRRLLANVLTNRGQYQRSFTLLDEAEALARQLDDRAPMARVLATMSWARRDMGDLDGAMAAASQSLEIAIVLNDPYAQAVASYRLGQAFASAGDFGRAAELFRGNVERLAPGAPDPARLALWINSRAWLANVLATLGEFDEGRRHGEEAVRLAMVRQGPSPIIAHGCLGLLYLAQGNLEAAVRVLEQGLALGRAADDRAWAFSIAGALGEAYARTGRLAEGLALLEETLRDTLQRGANLRLIVRRLSAAYRLAGRLDEARPHARQALDLARQQKARGEEAAALFALGAIHADAGPPDVQQAETSYREALALAEPRGMHPLVAHCHLGLGKLYRRTGKREQAQEHLTTATTMYRDMDMRFWLEQAEAELRSVS